jgi:hypothetical protein
MIMAFDAFNEITLLTMTGAIDIRMGFWKANDAS